jgi:regulator of protease activity HflC (stomatin/prohibitin superfamily)
MVKAITIAETHRGLWYEDGVFQRILTAGRYEFPRRKCWPRFVQRWLGSATADQWFGRLPDVSVQQVDMREQDLTIRGQEILTKDKVAIRVSILTRYRVIDPVKARHALDNYADRLYSDVQLGARRSLASMTLEEILTNRNQLSEDILTDTRESASDFGVEVLRADVKDLIFPGDLQVIMNRVLTAERMSEAKLIEARTQADIERLQAQTEADTQRLRTEVLVESRRREAEADAEAGRLRTAVAIEDLKAREQAASAYREHPALMRLEELTTLRALGTQGNARLYISFNEATPPGSTDE